MKKTILFLLFFNGYSYSVFPQAGMWTWMKGSSNVNYAGSFGTQGVSDILNNPPSLYESAHWVDDDGNFWMFGGYDGSLGYTSDLWKYNVTTNEWTWMKGPGSNGQPAVYGTLGIPATANNPGARSLGLFYWKDFNGDLWLYGGDGIDGSGSFGSLSDLWKYSVATNEWTWMGGNNSVFSQNPVWGTFQTFDPANLPGPRVEATASWVDSSGNFWLFGGNNVGFFNAMWKYDLSINEWAWMNGANFQGQTASYGTKGVFDAANHPSARYAYCTWKTDDNKLWLFGGGTDQYVFDDVWAFDPAINQWAWISGSNTTNTAWQMGSQCDSSDLFMNNSRMENTSRWMDACGRVWIFGGRMAQPSYSRLSDLCIYNPSSSNWIFMDGSLSYNQFPVYGTMGVAAATNDPGGRFGSCAWKDAAGNFWLYGGWNVGQDIFGDLWKYSPDLSCLAPCNVQTVAFTVSDPTICEKFCTDFFDSSSNSPTSWLWQFPGGSPSSSALQNPTGICYNNPGTYDVTLITTSANGSDTLTLSSYITVYPTPPIPVITQNGYTLTSTVASSYQWQFNNADIPGATNQSYSVTQTGYYSVFITDENGCFASATEYVLITGTEEIFVEESISVYPNPSDGKFMVELLNCLIDNRVTFQIVNMLGQVVYLSEEKISSSNWRKEIDLCRDAMHCVSTGIYFIEISINNSSIKPNGVFLRHKIIIAK